MNATVALLEPEIGTSRCAEELTQINESLQRREGLLAASAKAKPPAARIGGCEGGDPRRAQADR